MSSALIETLDALSNERPAVLQMKRRHFNPDVAPNKRESLEWMRINAERERIFKFKSIAKDTATQYYTILDRFSQELINPQKKVTGEQGSPVSPSNKIHLKMAQVDEDNIEAEASAKDLQVQDQTSLTGADKTQLSVSAGLKQGKNFKQVMSAAYKENQLHNVVRFVTDYLRQVIENGSRFTSGHFFIMLLQFSSSEIKNKAANYIKILAQEL